MARKLIFKAQKYHERLSSYISISRIALTSIIKLEFRGFSFHGLHLTLEISSYTVQHSDSQMQFPWMIAHIITKLQEMTSCVMAY